MKSDFVKIQLTQIIIYWGMKRLRCNIRMWSVGFLYFHRLVENTVSVKLNIAVLL